MWKAIGIALALVMPTAVQAGFLDGNLLNAQCKDKTPMCVGYITGFIDLHTTEVQMGMPPMFCPPKGEAGPKLGQYGETVRKYLEAHPENLKYEAASVVLQALIEVYPCKPK